MARSHRQLSEIAREHGVYAVEAYAFVSEGLAHAAQRHTEAGGAHIDAAQLIDGCIDLAAQRYANLGVTVLTSWGLRKSDDIGEITYQMIEAGIFGKQPSDRREDFQLGPDLATAIPERFHEQLRNDVVGLS